MSGNHGVGVGVGTGGAASPANIPPAGDPGAAAAFVVLSEVNGTGFANEAVDFSVTDWPVEPPVALMKSALLVFQVSLFPPANNPIPPSTRKRTGGRRVEGGF